MSDTNKSQFDPKVHLRYVSPSKVHKMADLALPELENGLSNVAVSEAFSLFLPNAIDIMKSEFLTKEVWDKHHFTSPFVSSQLRGYAKK